MFRVSRKALGQELRCKVLLLVPGEELEIVFNTNSTGIDIFDDLVKQLDLLDRDYYGLKFHDQIQWLDLSKSLMKQTKGLELIVFELRFKYYPAEPALLANESTRYYLYLQLRLDLLEGRLKSDSQATLAYLIACVLQSELGDFTTDMNRNYVSEFKFIPNQTETLEWEAIRLHQSEDFQGLRPADSELNFLKKACQLDTYGICPYPVKEGSSQNHFLIGVNHKGILAFQDSKKTNQFSWNEIERITIDSKLVLIYCRKLDKKGNKANKSRPLFGFRCPSQEYAHSFWKLATEHRYFFTLESTPDLPIVANTGGLFKKSHKLKYVGRVEKDLLRDHVDESRACAVKRSHSLMSKTSDGPRWQGFQTSGSVQSSLNNIYTSDSINKTMPSNLNYLREEEEEGEDQLADTKPPPLATRQVDSVSTDKRKRSSIGSNARDSPKTFNRRPVLDMKNVEPGNVIRKGSQIYMDTNQQTHDFVKTTIILILLGVLFLLTILLINDSDRPNSVSLLVKKMKLEQVSLELRQKYYLPLKSTLRNGIEQLILILDSRIL